MSWFASPPVSDIESGCLVSVWIARVWARVLPTIKFYEKPKLTGFRYCDAGIPNLLLEISLM